jgi:pimeloyl-ACP methyl ester carboxylesterase
LTLRREQLTLHGHQVTYRVGGEGPVLVLIHGIAGSSETWDSVLPALAEQHTVIAPDLLGHGESAKPRGDYSLGAFATGIRDLLTALDVDRATYVGHSLGGGIAMQLAYQFPERLARLVLVSSGGLGPEVNPMLRAVALPGAEYGLPLLFAAGMGQVANGVGKVLAALPFSPGADLEQILQSFERLGDVEARKAFVHTARSILDLQGQRVDARDRLYLAEEVPMLIVWGERDRVIPCSHGVGAHALVRGSRLELLPTAGHFPHRDEPERFVEILSGFVADTEPATVTTEDMRERVLAGPSA